MNQRIVVAGLKYVAAALAVGVATAVTIALRPWIEGSISLFFFPVIVTSALYGGYGPALCATVLAAIAMAYYLVPPYNSFDIGADDVIRLSVFAAVAIVTASVSSARKRAEDARRRAMGELERALGTMTKVTDWPVFADVSVRAGVRRLLEHAAAVVDASAAVAVWELDEEPWMYVGRSAGDHVEKLTPADLIPIVPAEIAERPFVSTVAAGVAIHPRIAASWPAGDAVASASFHVELLHGRAFFAGIKNTSPETIPLVEVVSREIGNSLDQLYMQDRLRQLAVREDRIRVARDLHDGVLQSLTGIRYQLQALAADPVVSGPVTSGLLAAERALAIEQRELRHFIDDLKPADRTTSRDGSLARRIADLRDRLAIEWKTAIVVRVEPPTLALDADLDRAVALMIHEAVINALKHAQASRVSVELTAIDRALHITVADDGRGFPFRGRLDHPALVGSKAGPVSLRERVESVGGTLAVDSRSTGSRIDITIPAPVTPGLTSSPT